MMLAMMKQNDGIVGRAFVGAVAHLPRNGNFNQRNCALYSMCMKRSILLNCKMVKRHFPIYAGTKCETKKEDMHDNDNDNNTDTKEVIVKRVVDSDRQ